MASATKRSVQNLEVKCTNQLKSQIHNVVVCKYLWEGSELGHGLAQRRERALCASVALKP